MLAQKTLPPCHDQQSIITATLATITVGSIPNEKSAVTNAFAVVFSIYTRLL